MSENITALLDAAQKTSVSRGVGSLAAFGQVVFGTHARLADSPEGFVVVGCVNSKTVVVNQSFECVTTNLTRCWETLEMMCDDGAAGWEEISCRARALELFRPFGAGIQFVLSGPFNFDMFVSTVEKYNCPRVVGERIALDLLNVGERTTTVQSHLVDHWDAMQKDLKLCHVDIYRTIPQLTANTIASTNLEQKVDALKRQFKR